MKLKTNQTPAPDSRDRPFLLANAEVLDPATGVRARHDLIVMDGRVRMAAPGDHPEDAPVYDLTGRVAVPGFIDPHVHLREPGNEDAENIASGTAAAARGGFVGVASMANTHPPVDDPQSVRFVLERARQAGLSRVYPMAAVSRDLAGKEITDMFDLAEAGAVAFSDDGMTIMDANLMRRALQYASMLDKVIVSHAEDNNLKGTGVAHEGFMATKLGLRPVPRAAEEVIVARDIHLVELTGGRLHVAHVSCEKTVDMIREAQRRGLRVTGEASPHHLCFTDQNLAAYDPNFKMAPPLREESDRQAIIQGLREGVIGAIATDHAPHTEISKDVEFDAAPNGVIGMETAFAALHTALVEPGHVDLATLVRAMSIGPAEILGVPHGPIREGGPADITVLDLETTWEVKRADFASRSFNCPWLGRTLLGRPVLTVSEGRVLSAHSSLQAVETGQAVGS